MGLDLGLVGETWGPFHVDYTHKNLALYALSVGANVQGELPYIYEKEQKIVPSYWPSILGLETFMDCYYYGQSLPHTVHYGFEVEYLDPIVETSGAFSYTVNLKAIYDRGEGKGSVGEIEAVGRDAAGKPRFALRTWDLDLSTGGFGGEKPPMTREKPPERPADYEVKDYIGPNQAALYRIENDPNILHIDEEFAKAGGFEQPILMGMCTVGFACRALIQSICPGRPEAIRYMKVWFSNIIVPGTAVVTQIWKEADGRVLFRLLNEETGDVVLNCCVATVVA